MRTTIYGLLLVGAFLRGQSTNSTPAAADRKALAKMEDSLANQFLDIRKGVGLRPLTRIKNRSGLRQMVCTAAVRGQYKQWGTVVFKSSNPTTPDPLFEQMAKFDVPRQKPPTVPTDASVGTFRTGGMPKIERFAVAVWPSQVKDEYWVGVGLYWGAGWEWFDLHLTDDHYYGNLWKKNIAAECKEVK
jgi:hypothetical protein